MYKADATGTPICNNDTKLPVLALSRVNHVTLSAMEGMFVSPQNSSAEALTSNVMIFGGEAFGR